MLGKEGTRAFRDEDSPPYICTECGELVRDGQLIDGAKWDHEARTGLHWKCRNLTGEKND